MHSAAYTVRLVAAVSLVGSVLVSGSAVLLADRQEANRRFDQRRKILGVAGLVVPGEDVTREEVNRRFDRDVRITIVDLSSGAAVSHPDPARFDQRRASQDPRTSHAAPPNAAGVARLPNEVAIYQVTTDGALRTLVFPIEGKGLWSTLYGYVALSADLETVEGITFYEHAETPGLGGNINEPRWTDRWKGRRLFDEAWTPRLEVIKGPAASPAAAPYEVDGLSGATLTGRGVTNILQFWFGADGFGPYLQRYRAERGIP